MLKNPFFLVIFFIGLIGIFLAVKQVQLPQIFAPKANVVGVTLSILPSKITMDPNQAATLEIALNPADEIVTASEIKLRFDSSVIEITDIKPTDQLPQSLAMDLSKPGEAGIILLTNPSNDKTPTGVIGRIFVRALKPGETTLKFDPTTQISALGKTADVTGALEGVNITVFGNQNPENIAPQASVSVSEDAENLITTYVENQTNQAIPADSGNFTEKYSKAISEYIKTLVNDINSGIEKQARKVLD